MSRQDISGILSTLNTRDPDDSPDDYSDSDVETEDCVIVISHDDEPICFVNSMRRLGTECGACS